MRTVAVEEITLRLLTDSDDYVNKVFSKRL
jgi:hypothetical protein